MLKINRVIIFIITILINLSCIEDNVPVESTKDFEESALLLRELEERGDFINTNEFPALVTAENVYKNMDNYIIIDVRGPEEYSSGHIPNSVNITNDDLFDYTTNLETNGKMILLVSNTGQAAAYYLTLLRYAGVKNIYSLKFGISVWNKELAYLWKDNFFNFIDDKLLNQPIQFDFNNIALYVRNPSGKLPTLNPDNDQQTINDFTSERVSSIIKLGFDEKSKGNILTENTVGIEYVTSRDYKNTEEFFIICFGNAALYHRPNTSRGCLLLCSSHPWGTHMYNAFPPYTDFKSTTDLQTLPNDKPIIIYSFTGERSAMAVAYLKLFGYNAKSVVFGGQYMFRSRFITTNFHSSELLASFGVQEEDFKDYPISN